MNIRVFDCCLKYIKAKVVTEYSKFLNKIRCRTVVFQNKSLNIRFRKSRNVKFISMFIFVILHSSTDRSLFRRL